MHYSTWTLRPKPASFWSTGDNIRRWPRFQRPRFGQGRCCEERRCGSGVGGRRGSFFALVNFACARVIIINLSVIICISHHDHVFINHRKRAQRVHAGLEIQCINNWSNKAGILAWKRYFTNCSTLFCMDALLAEHLLYTFTDCTLITSLSEASGFSLLSFPFFPPRSPPNIFFPRSQEVTVIVQCIAVCSILTKWGTRKNATIMVNASNRIILTPPPPPTTSFSS